MEKPGIIHFFKEEKARVLYGHIGVMVILTGIASIALLGIINEVAFNQRDVREDLIFYGLAMFIFALGTRSLNIKVTQVVERQLLAIRLRILDRIRAADLKQVEGIGKEDINIALSQDIALVSNSADMLISAIQQSILLLFCVSYVAWLSPLAFFIVVGSIIITYLLIAKLQQILQKNYHRLGDEEGKLYSRLDHLINGFKEIKLNQAKSDAIYAEYRQHVEETERLKVENRVSASWAILSSHLFMYTLLGAIVFALPLLADPSGGLVGKLVATVLFILTPLLLILEGVPTIERANSSLERIYQLEKQFKHEETLSPTAKDDVFSKPKFNQLQLDNVVFCYNDNSQFSVGPIDLVINRGEILFITGGNGSGKSTLLKLLCGLYHPQSGTIQLNQMGISPVNLNQLKEQFAVIFTDFHLFDKFYGLTDVDDNRVQQLIDKMELTGKVNFVDGRFSTLQLSTGQRKRLALIMALLDDRDIYIFDEWAADQDAHFRRYFYEEILPELKAAGKAVIAVTHDDRYWSYCDRLIKLDLGRIQEQHDHRKKTKSSARKTEAVSAQ
ncbi:cyclic peptide export ABC transporter [Aliikangiella coralliicola]|uniref:Cyclic peptide export ABC transporter n=1 Tax=Aliikangiella coralliicola TaxID=2592383 RepID=A0A545U982_9GAMM|nr:cyclic peptide export ABC transporter [Aliikangiella coralliicola]TQV85973.1 cyclic peptide export ABC transporter [Aliikangiella coralliicola]